MPSKWIRRLLLVFAAVIGFFFGLARPETTQSMLSVIGIAAGLGYFILSRSTEDGEKDSSSETTFNRWFLVIQMLLYFIIGGAIGSMIPFLMTFREQQQSLLFIQIRG